MSTVAASRATITFASASFLLLVAGFRQNLWRATESSLFASNQKDTEALVIGRMVWSRQHGFFGGAGLLGFVGTGSAVVTFDTSELWGAQSFDFQTEAYLKEIPIRSFSPYFSHSGLQGMAFATLDGILARAPPALKLSLFLTLTSALVAATYVVLLLWLRREFGMGTALLCLLVILGSPWLTAFARNIYWSLWLYLLPPLGIGAVLSTPLGRNNQNRRLAIVAFLTLLVRFLAGYEFATVTAAMALAPVLYDSIRNTQRLRVFLSRLGLLVGAALAALIVSLAVLTLQITAETGSARNVVNHIRFAIGRRASGDPSKFPPVYADALKANAFGVLRGYLLDPVDRQADLKRLAPLRWLLSRRQGEILVCVILAAGWAAIRTAWLPADRRFGPLALAAATLCVLSGILAWLVIFKAHSFIHVHVNPLMFHLLYLPLGAALVSFAVKDAALLSARTLLRR